ncbi:hypothetical protein [Reyranella sp.]|uniref:hypothetical protein n=1 Tax=Reyranella sp. TaxID=1929291 RepID=UPI003BA8FE49
MTEIKVRNWARGILVGVAANRSPPPARSRPSEVPLSVQIIARKERIEFWLCRGQQAVCRQKDMPKALVADARRHGQDLVEESINALLQHIETRRGMSRLRHQT